jgi:uncharacterized protein (DUF3820 family)
VNLSLLAHSQGYKKYQAFGPEIKIADRMDRQILIDLVTKTMPFGKYKGRLLCDIPEHYLVWMHRQGFPEGKLGMWLSTLYEIRLNGLEYILTELKNTVNKKPLP